MTARRKATRYRAFSILMVVVLVATVGVLSCNNKNETEVVIGALLCLSGDNALSGEFSQAALEIAVEDVNEHLFDVGADIRVRLVAEDTGTDPEVALEKLKVLAEEGVQIVIGPQTNAEVEAIKAYADEEGILVISQSSTVPSLAVPGDNIFRFVPDDTQQAAALVEAMWEDGIGRLIPMWRGDMWGDELSEATKAIFEALGGTVLDGVRYSVSTEDFSTAVHSLSEQVKGALLSCYACPTAVLLIAFEEVVPIFIAAQVKAQDESILDAVEWYGSAGTVKNKELMQNPQAAEFAVEVVFPNPVYGNEDEEGKFETIWERIREEVGGSPDVYAIAAYDALWVAALTYVDTGGTEDTDALKKALPQTARSFSGATGLTTLNEAGDREHGSYQFWHVVEDDGAFQWEHVP